MAREGDIGRRGCARPPRDEVRWLPPEMEVLKINVDAATFKDGWVGMGSEWLRNNEGCVVRVACQQVRQNWEV